MADFSIENFRKSLGGFGPVEAQRRAMQPGQGRQLVSQAIGIDLGSSLPSRRASVVARQETGMAMQTRVLMAADGSRVSVAYVGEQPAAVASIALRGMQPNVPTANVGMRA